MPLSTELASWIAEEQIILSNRTRGEAAEISNAVEASNMSGLDSLRAVIAGKIPHSPMSQTLDFMLISADDGIVTFQGAPNSKPLNPMGTVHGGWFATLLDSALGCAVLTKLPAGTLYATAELSLNLVRAITPEVSRVRAIGNVIHCGRRMATAEAKLIGADGTLFAHATTTCLVLQSS